MAEFPRDDRLVPISVLTPGTTMIVAIGATTTASAGVDSSGVFRLVATSDCHINIDGDPPHPKN